MLFQHTIDKVLSGEKTQTRRIVKPGDVAYETIPNYWTGKSNGYAAVNRGGRIVYMLGYNYAVQPGRGKPAVARMRVLNILREDVREISEYDVRAEGFASYRDFMWTWVSMHDKSHARMIERYELNTDYGVHQRPVEFYDAWVIKFELVSNG